MSFVVQGAIEIDIEKAKKGVADLRAELDEVAKQPEKQTKSFSGLAKNFSSNLKKMSTSSSTAGKIMGQAFITALGPIGLLLMAVKFIIDIFKKAVASSEGARESLDELGELIDTIVTPIFEALGAAVKVVIDFFVSLISLFSSSTKESRALAKEQKKLGEEMKNIQEEIKKINEEGRKHIDVLKLLGATELEQKKAALEMMKKQLNEEAKRLSMIYEYNRKATLQGKLNERIAQSEIVKLQMFLKESKKKIDGLEKELKLVEKQEEAEKKNLERIEKWNSAYAQMQKERKLAVDFAKNENTEAEKIRKQKELELQAMEKYKGVLVEILSNEKLNTKEKQNALNQYYEISRQIGEMNKQSREALYIEDMRTEIAQKNAQLEMEKNILAVKVKNGLLSQKEAEEEIYKLALKHNEAMYQIYGTYSGVVGATDELNNNLKKIDQTTGQSLANVSTMIKEVGNVAMQATQSIVTIISNIGQAQVEAIQKNLDKQKQLIDEHHNYAMERLEDERQRLLEFYGFAEATTEENLERAMEAAERSHDNRIIYLEKRRQQELKINKDFDKKEKAEKERAEAEKVALEKQAQEEIAEIQYKMAMSQWVASIAQAGINIAEAITKALAQTGIFGLATVPIIAGLGAIQLGAIMSGMPKKPSFAEGGVVGLATTYGGGFANGGIVKTNTPRGVDAVDVRVGNREMILNDEQQAGLFNAIDSGSLGGGGNYNIELQIVLRDIELARGVIEIVNDGRTPKIEARMVGA